RDGLTRGDTTRTDRSPKGRREVLPWTERCTAHLRNMAALLTSFQSLNPSFRVSQGRTHTWLAAVTAEIEEVAEVVDGAAVIYDLPDEPTRAGPGARARLTGEVLDKYFASSYAPTAEPPDELIHVTCDGSVTPSGAQRLVADRRWPTRVTHLYRQGGHA